MWPLPVTVQFPSVISDQWLPNKSLSPLLLTGPILLLLDFVAWPVSKPGAMLWVPGSPAESLLSAGSSLAATTCFHFTLHITDSLPR